MQATPRRPRIPRTSPKPNKSVGNGHSQFEPRLLLARAAQARAEGEEATLTHVRERCQRSEAAWQALADKAKRSERLREEEAKRKSELLAAQ